MEFISRFQPENAIFGIANVESSTCELTIGYYLSENALTLILPQSCNSCRKSQTCNRQFGTQIIGKYNQKHKGQEIYFLF